MAKKNVAIESVLDLNSNNIWTVDEHTIASLWEDDRREEGFVNSEDKLVNIIRLAFEVVHYNPDNQREAERYENGDWAILVHANPAKGNVAFRKKNIRRITDLSYENVKHISAATLLELIDRNFGGGWDSIPLSIKDIIESAFDISTTQLPATRMHAPGGTMERKIAQGFEVLEIPKGTWIEAIFAKKMELVDKVRYVSASPKFDEEGNLIDDEDNGADSIDDDDNDSMSDEEFYSSYSEEAATKELDEEGFPMEDE